MARYSGSRTAIHLGETKITGPAASQNVFPVTNDGVDGIPILKLHGSLNWYSLYRDNNPTPAMLLKNNREIRMTTRRSINPNFRYIGGARAQNTRPVVVPPVSHKSGVLHAKLRDIWALAEARLTAANELLIFGYSCPPIDFESVNMLQRGFGVGSKKLLRIIDPDSAALMRYVELLQPKHCEYFPTAKDFLAK